MFADAIHQAKQVIFAQPQFVGGMLSGWLRLFFETVLIDPFKDRLAATGLDSRLNDRPPGASPHWGGRLRLAVQFLNLGFQLGNLGIQRAGAI